MNDLQTAPIGKRIFPRRGDFDGEGYVPDFPVTYQPVRAGVFHVYLFGAIEESTQFIGAIEALQAAGDNDVVVIHLSTPGGSLDATDTFLQAMHECEGRVIVKASGGCHSAGSIILMHAPEFTLSDNFSCLIHNGSTGSWGKYSDFKAQTKHSTEYMERVMRNSYEGFLTEDEIEALLDGKDYWLNAEEFCARYESRNEYMRDKMQGQQVLMQAQQFNQCQPLAVEYEAEDEIEVTPRPPARKRKK